MQITKAIARRFGRNLAINGTIALTVGTALFALHVNTPHHTDPTISQHMTAPVWTK